MYTETLLCVILAFESDAGVLVVLLWDPIPTLHTEYSTKQSNLILQKLPHLYIIQERRKAA